MGARQKGVVGRHPARGAVFDEHVREAPSHLRQPSGPRAAVLEQTVARAVRALVGAVADRVVVVNLEVADTVADHAIKDRGEVGAGLRLAHVEAHPVLLDDRHPVTLHAQRLEAGSHRGVHAHREGFDPQPRNHAVLPDHLQDRVQPTLEARCRGHPLPHVGPPVRVALVGEPAGVDTKHLSTRAGGSRNERGEFRRIRVCLEGVEVVVEDDGGDQLLFPARPAQRTAIVAHLGDGALPARGRERERRRRRRERLPWLENAHPGVLQICGAVDRQAEGLVAAGELNSPAPVVFDLPADARSRLVLDVAGRRKQACGPAAFSGEPEGVTGGVSVHVGADVNEEVGEPVALPPVFGHPPRARETQAKIVKT